ncbi:DUF4190 domain-containing protein [Streptomyces virginiae]|uniref:DUF4190 domain-containing protein n=1 Tax=Streptomyces virginiae TaxID=1961 RepID=UPI002DDBC09B|nr:DUF4190 domain-containing protein [Streptomyces virginiae]WSC80126.1 DUF4190 domain-containing protein [Streptomyces virginiae]
MTDSSPEPRDPWAPLERPPVELGKSQGGQGTPGASGPPSVHDQPTLAGMPGDPFPPPAQTPAQIPTPTPTQHPMTGPPASAAYGYPAQPGYGFPGDAGYPAQPGQQGYAGQQGYPGYPGPQGYPGQGAYPPYGAQRSNGFGVTALVLGILAVVGCITSFFALALGIAAVVFGVLGRGKASRGEADNGGMALAGIILGAIGIVLGAVMIAIVFAGFMERGSGGDSPYDSPYDNSQVREKV